MKREDRFWNILTISRSPNLRADFSISCSFPAPRRAIVVLMSQSPRDMDRATMLSRLDDRSIDRTEAPIKVITEGSCFFSMIFSGDSFSRIQEDIVVYGRNVHPFLFCCVWLCRVHWYPGDIPHFHYFSFLMLRSTVDFTICRRGQVYFKWNQRCNGFEDSEG